MKFVSILLGFSILSGCNTPSVGFAPSQSFTASEDGYDFKIYLNDKKIQAVRTNSGRPKSKENFYSALDTAVFQLTNCYLDKSTIGGDLNLITANLDCGSRH